MKFLHINNSNDIGKTSDLIRELKNGVETGKDIFILIYMEGCGPCNSVRPEWKKLENIFKNSRNQNVMIVDIDKDILEKAKTIIKEPIGFPTIQYITNRGEFQEDFEKSNISNKKREIDAFEEWINSKIKTSLKGGKSKKSKKSGKSGKSVKGRRTKKWSLKYKHSINCGSPKGFSQRQYCNYGRNKSKRNIK